jgi:hypothetical protein
VQASSSGAADRLFAAVGQQHLGALPQGPVPSKGGCRKVTRMIDRILDVLTAVVLSALLTWGLIEYLTI